jgi:hypothetical protein
MCTCFFFKQAVVTRPEDDLSISRNICRGELFVPTNALRQFFHCFLYYYDAPNTNFDSYSAIIRGYSPFTTQTGGKEVLPTHNTQITGIHAENRTTLPLINNYTIEGSIIYCLILL